MMPPRPATEEEVPIIDLTPMTGDLEARKGLGHKCGPRARTRDSSTSRTMGFRKSLLLRPWRRRNGFLTSHCRIKRRSPRTDPLMARLGIRQLVKRRPTGPRRKVLDLSASLLVTGKSISLLTYLPTDHKENFSFQYDARLDPEAGPELEADQQRSKERYALHDSLWEGVSHLDGFRDAMVTFWQRRLELARKLCRIFALSLDLPEDYLDSVITHPGADAVCLHYPGTDLGSDNTNKEIDVGIGSHTDIQCFTFLWQDPCGGLQLLSRTGQWLKAQPIPGTIVVNIADLLQRLSNNRFKSTV